MASKETDSSSEAARVSWTMAIEPTRRTASLRASRALGESMRRACMLRRGHGLQVVLHPVMNLPDRGVLGEQLPVAAVHLGHVPHQHDRPDVGRAIGQRDGAQVEHHRVGLDLNPPRYPAARH